MRSGRLLLAAFLAFGSMDAFACMPVLPDPVREAVDADLVFVGRVVEERERDHVLIVASLENLKGVARGNVIVPLPGLDTTPGVVNCGGGLQLEPGDDSLVFRKGTHWWLRPRGGAFESTLRIALAQ